MYWWVGYEVSGHSMRRQHNAITDVQERRKMNVMYRNRALRNSKAMWGLTYVLKLLINNNFSFALPPLLLFHRTTSIPVLLLVGLRQVPPYCPAEHVVRLAGCSSLLLPLLLVHSADEGLPQALLLRIVGPGRTGGGVPLSARVLALVIRGDLGTVFKGLQVHMSEILSVGRMGVGISAYVISREGGIPTSIE